MQEDNQLKILLTSAIYFYKLYAEEILVNNINPVYSLIVKRRE
jgi:hypothetical protein